MFEYSEMDGLTDGDYIFIIKREPILKIFYESNAVVGYATLSKTGGFSEKSIHLMKVLISFPNYPNGKLQLK